MNTRVKICCIKSIEEAEMAIRYGASALGFVSAMPSGPGPISEDLIADIIPRLPAGVSTFLLTSKQDAPSIIDQQRRTNANTVQLVDAVPFETYRELKNSLPSVSIVQVVHVTGNDAIAATLSVAPFVDALLLDSGNPNLPVKQLGGTGRVHDWTVSKTICALISKPVYLAGGLNPENVADAIRLVRPFGVDLCNGVRTNGSLDETKLSRFFDAAKQA
ncbi:MAG: phosphoribosylanthranilate isomerase [Ignavibacteriales bacterium]|nr:phosphoribosylanthranilate isomerase [Ignavibacteriales bacterium]